MYLKLPGLKQREKKTLLSSTYSSSLVNSTPQKYLLRSWIDNFARLTIPKWYYLRDKPSECIFCFYIFCITRRTFSFLLFSPYILIFQFLI